MTVGGCCNLLRRGFSALQRAEIAEIGGSRWQPSVFGSFSALQRAEIAEIALAAATVVILACFSALQRAEIAEIPADRRRD